MGALGIGDRRQHAHRNKNKYSEQRINEQAFPFMQFQCGHGGDEPESSLCERSSVFTPAGSKHRKHARSRQSGCQKQRQIAPEWAGGARSRAQICLFLFSSSSPLPVSPSQRYKLAAGHPFHGNKAQAECWKLSSNTTHTHTTTRPRKKAGRPGAASDGEKP